MRVLIIGAKGEIAKAVVPLLTEQGVEVVTASRSSGDVFVDATNPHSVEEMFRKIPPIEGVICAFGASVPIKNVDEITVEDLEKGAQQKLFSQIGIATTALRHMDKGSIILTGGIVGQKVLIEGGSILSFVNGALAAFVRAWDTKKNVRINLVSPTLLTSSEKEYGTYFPGIEPVTATRAAKGYIQALLGPYKGENIEIHG
ncbi:MAG: short chain dehydrogenase [Chlamydiota bacterium]